MNGLLIKATGEASLFELKGTEADYERLTEAIGGLLQAVPLSDTISLYCHDEGKVLDLPGNLKASKVWEHFYGNTDTLAGHIVLTGAPNAQGYDTGLTEADLELIG